MTAENPFFQTRPTAKTQKPLINRGLMSSDDDCERLRKLSALGLEPRTYGLKVRCSTN